MIPRNNASYRHAPNTGSAIMQSLQSLDSPSLFGQTPDLSQTQLHSLRINDDESLQNISSSGKSFKLINGQEELLVKSTAELLKKLKIEDTNTKIKVVSIFGNTGDGKSHTLNETFFDGVEVFCTGSEQGPRTLGVWAAWDPSTKALVLDTEGLQGVSTGKMNIAGGSHDEQRTRLLLKVLAVSDVVLYRTRSERLRRDLYTFLGSASRAYAQHFSAALLKAATDRLGDHVGPDTNGDSSSLGPALIIFHETRYTKVLESTVSESAEDIIRERFLEMNLDVNAFSSLRYVGVQTGAGNGPPIIPWSQLQSAVRRALEDTAVRAPRNPEVVYETLRALNDKFSGEIPATVDDSMRSTLFPDQYFSCGVICESCRARCDRSMGHLREGAPHGANDRSCKFQRQFENCVYICKACHNNGRDMVVFPRQSATEGSSWLGGLARYAWSGYIIDCPNCGEIYRSRQYWYGNPGPEESSAVITNVVHVWPGVDRPLMNVSGSSQVSAQRVIDGVSYISEAVASVSAPPSRVVSSWFADQIAPKYWRPNHEIKYCYACNKTFATTDAKHHCRACGEGFCDPCSQKQKPVPERGWETPVRVCNSCFDKSSNPVHDTRSRSDPADELEADLRARRYGEAVVNTISSVASAVIEYPREIIKESARPSYWQPDAEAFSCGVCSGKFGNEPENIGRLHHCRACGKAVCGDCSSNQKSVPERGWTEPVRVCDNCYGKRSD